MFVMHPHTHVCSILVGRIVRPRAHAAPTAGRAANRAVVVVVVVAQHIVGQSAAAAVVE